MLQKLFGWQAMEKARNFAGLTKLQSYFKTESQLLTGIKYFIQQNYQNVYTFFYISQVDLILTIRKKTILTQK